MSRHGKQPCRQKILILSYVLEGVIRTAKGCWTELEGAGVVLGGGSAVEPQMDRAGHGKVNSWVERAIFNMFQ